MADQQTIDLGAGNLRYEDYPIEAHVRMASRTIKGFSRWIPPYGTVEAIPEPWNEPKPGWMVLDGDQPVLCNTGKNKASWSGTWSVTRDCTYENNCIIVTNARTGARMFAVTNLTMSKTPNDDGSWTWDVDDQINVTINNLYR